MGTNHDEKIVEPTMKSRNTGLFDKIVKPAKIIKSWNPEPHKCRYNLKIVCACANDAAPEICTIQPNVWLERNTY